MKYELLHLPRKTDINLEMIRDDTCELLSTMALCPPRSLELLIYSLFTLFRGLMWKSAAYILEMSQSQNNVYLTRICRTFVYEAKKTCSPSQVVMYDSSVRYEALSTTLASVLSRQVRNNTSDTMFVDD